MFVVIVKFKISDSVDNDSIKEKFKETAPMYQETKGLIRKNYLFNESKNIAGGVYIFDNSENGFAWFDESRIQWLTDRYSQPEITYFDSPVEVNNDSNKIYIEYRYNHTRIFDDFIKKYSFTSTK